MNKHKATFTSAYRGVRCLDQRDDMHSLDHPRYTAAHHCYLKRHDDLEPYKVHIRAALKAHDHDFERDRLVILLKSILRRPL